MSYTALYRKRRPHTFENIIGQGHIVQTLTNQILSGRTVHAYLFCGTRGTGKTSAAKIFAKAVNCENPQNASPCLVCASCENIAAGRAMHVVEIDAASNNGVDNIRDIRDEVKYPPTEGKYRVYIIDEVHMLTGGAFNALLKTLEEPPPYVIFILATTDPQKIPATVLSRVQRFDFRRIAARDLAKAMRSCMDNEQVSISDDALAYIAQLSDGAMRDAWSLLDQCLAFYYRQDITLDKVLDIVGSVDNRALFDLTQALTRFDAAACLSFVDDLVMQGRDVNQFVADLIAHFRNLLVAKHMVGDATTALAFSAENIEKLKAQGAALAQETLIAFIHAFSELQADARYAANPRVLLEVQCIKLCNPAAAADDNQNQETSALLARLQKLETVLENGVLTPVGAHSVRAPDARPPEPVRKKEKVLPGDIEAVIKDWQSFALEFGSPLKNHLQAATPCFLEGGALTIVSNSITGMDVLQKYAADIEAHLLETFQKAFTVVFMDTDAYQARHKNVYGATDATISEKPFTDILGHDNITFTND